ncbi:hypothetical protein HYALB_00001839 [Hymenoscyphus albidus]|uniref:Uncharacterized protein n=1 Tax=Hymenoscyphus albidus TaxID=595503 RepID=A0A9N9LQG1_9HELO|nr:hypothetical protein HYALB_00001839 [Hymenoscyphus albidus]
MESKSLLEVPQLFIRNLNIFANRYQSDGNSLSAYRHEVDNDLLVLQRKLQFENPDSTVFTAVLCPEQPEGQPMQFAVARVFLDTGSDVNVIFGRYLNEVGLGHLITQIPEEEQVEMGGIVEQGKAWKFLSSAEENTAGKRSLWMPKKKRSQKDEAEQRTFEQSRLKELEKLRQGYAQRENQKRLNSQPIGVLPEAGRAWTVDERRRALMSGSISTAEGDEGPSSIRMTSMDDQRSQKQIEASMRSGKMQDESDDGSISGPAGTGI